MDYKKLEVCQIEQETNPASPVKLFLGLVGPGRILSGSQTGSKARETDLVRPICTLIPKALDSLVLCFFSIKIPFYNVNAAFF